MVRVTNAKRIIWSWLKIDNRENILITNIKSISHYGFNQYYKQLLYYSENASFDMSDRNIKITGILLINEDADVINSSLPF